MKRFILLVLLLGTQMAAHSQEKMKVLIENAPFMMYCDFSCSLSSDIYWKSNREYENVLKGLNLSYTDIENLKRDFPMHYVGKGTEVVVLGKNWEGTMLKVRLSDGSLGYMPTIAFVPESDLTFVLPQVYDEMPAGKYTFAGLGEMVQCNENDMSVLPKYYLYKSEADGRKYRVNIGKPIYFDGVIINSSRTRWFYLNHSELIFEKFYNKYPGIECFYSDDDVRGLELKNGELPLTFVGYSKSYLESIIGPPFSYAGPGMSEYRGYTYAYYENVGWDIEVTKYDDSGIIFWFDSDMKVVHMEKAPLNPCLRKSNFLLCTPMNSGAEPDPAIASKIEMSRMDSMTFRSAEMGKEEYCAPVLWDRLRLESLSFVERRLGLTNILIIFGILLLLSAMVTYGLLRVVLILPCSNAMLKLLSVVACAPALLYVSSYVLRFNRPTSYLMVFLVFSCICGGLMLLIDYVNANRCNACRKWSGPEVIKSEHLSGVSYSTPSCNLNEGRYVDSDSLDHTSGGVRTRARSTARNYKTTLELSWDVRQTLKCPDCGHEWDYDTKLTLPVIGPIGYAVSTSINKSWDEKEVTNRKLIDKASGEVLAEDESSRIVRNGSNSSTHYTIYDWKRYKPYLDRYLNGDKEALREYEKQYFGKFFG